VSEFNPSDAFWRARGQIMSSGAKGNDVIDNQRDIKKIFEKFWEDCPGYWAVGKSLKKLRLEAGIEWVSRNESFRIPTRNGVGGEWKIINNSQYCSWKLKHLFA